MKKLEELKVSMMWSDEDLHEFIHEIAEAISDKTATSTATTPAAELTDERVSRYLREMGAPTNLKGFYYIKEALRLLYVQPSMAITKELYPEVACRFTTTPSRIERSIRHCIERIFDNPNEDLIEKVFGYSVDQDKGRPTNSGFLSASVEFFKLQKF